MYLALVLFMAFVHLLVALSSALVRNGVMSQRLATTGFFTLTAVLLVRYALLLRG